MRARGAAVAPAVLRQAGQAPLELERTQSKCHSRAAGAGSRVRGEENHNGDEKFTRFLLPKAEGGGGAPRRSRPSVRSLKSS